jgi:Holliday junction resolvase YEN1
LIALMSGGDYIPEGIPGCGPKTACEAARAGFGTDLCKISRKDKTSLKVWRERLAYELRTNESKYFKRKHGALEIPEDFPNSEVLGYYTHPCISPPDKVIRLRDSLKWDQDLNFTELRTFTAEAFDWTKLGGAKKFIRNLSPALLVRELRMGHRTSEQTDSDNIQTIQRREGKLINAIHGKRNHASTDMVTELRISFIPHTLVPIDLDVEEPDDEIPIDSGDEGRDDENEGAGDAPTSPSKKRGPSTYDPTVMEKVWVFETYVKVGVPLKVQDWEESLRSKCVSLKPPSKEAAAKARKPKGKTAKAAKSTMPQGALDCFTRVTKPGQHLLPALAKSNAFENVSENSRSRSSPPETQPSSQPSKFRVPPPFSSTLAATSTETIDLLSSPASSIPRHSAPKPILSSSLEYDLPSTVTKRRRSPFRRTQTDTAILDLTSPSYLRPTTPPRLGQLNMPDSPLSLPSPSQLLPTKRMKRAVITKGQQRKQKNGLVERLSPNRQTDIVPYFSPSRQNRSTETLQGTSLPPPTFEAPSTQVRAVEELDLTESPLQPGFSVHEDSGERLSKEKVGAAARPSLHELSSNQVNSRPRDRRSKSSSNTFVDSSMLKPTSNQRTRTPLPAQEIEALDLTGDHLSISNSPFFHVPARPCPTTTRTLESRDLPTTLPDLESNTSQPRKKTKEFIRMRESLDGAFAVERIDLSSVEGERNMARLATTSRGSRKLFRMSEVSVLDLTGE